MDPHAYPTCISHYIPHQNSHNVLLISVNHSGPDGDFYGFHFHAAVHYRVWNSRSIQQAFFPPTRWWQGVSIASQWAPRLTSGLSHRSPTACMVRFGGLSVNRWAADGKKTVCQTPRGLLSLIDIGWRAISLPLTASRLLSGLCHASVRKMRAEG